MLKIKVTPEMFALIVAALSFNSFADEVTVGAEPIVVENLKYQRVFCYLDDVISRIIEKASLLESW